ncbi:hypothetical protein Y032_0123g1147 [Ancylostoma ceylanicum]|uniref:Uncharacterized protein n=1 Tax=Ancylostoma ceylanicum TaxID=53326 RepID=A0A016T9G4_9BILA|nr:hypothetical protein Y032_0123g1147 [Ancylostoma ceylanicum]
MVTLVIQSTVQGGAELYQRKLLCIFAVPHDIRWSRGDLSCWSLLTLNIFESDVSESDLMLAVYAEQEMEEQLFVKAQGYFCIAGIVGSSPMQDGSARVAVLQETRRRTKSDHRCLNSTDSSRQRDGVQISLTSMVWIYQFIIMKALMCTQYSTSATIVGSLIGQKDEKIPEVVYGPQWFCLP